MLFALVSKKLNMRLFLFIGIVFGASLTLHAQEVEWMALEEALAAQKKKPKKIIMDVYTTWCGPCKMMDKFTFANPDVARYINENFYPVKFNGEGNDTIKYKGNKYRNPYYDPKKANTRNSPHLFAYSLGVKAYPSLVYFDESGDVIQAIPGYLEPNELELFLKLINTDDYKKITTAEAWEEYQENFEPQFKTE
tara:strand:- start:3155 stop:3736 length:582 start_codon:yes stop_codon:yes gene_type:complete